jgi:hypothetical protein
MLLFGAAFASGAQCQLSRPITSAKLTSRLELPMLQPMIMDPRRAKKGGDDHG